MGNYPNNNLPQNDPIEKSNNRVPSGIYKRPTYHNAPSQENNFSKEQKLDKQKAYRDLLYQQVILKKQLSIKFRFLKRKNQHL